MGEMLKRSLVEIAAFKREKEMELELQKQMGGNRKPFEPRRPVGRNLKYPGNVL